MIDELYDAVLSITNQTGYIDRVLEKKEKSFVRPSTINPDNLIKIIPTYPVIFFSYDNHFRSPFTFLINEDNSISNLS